MEEHFQIQALAPVSLEGFVAFLAALFPIIAFVIWRQTRREKLAREQFLSQFEVSKLKMSPRKIGLVYLVVREERNSISIVPVWDGKSKVINGQEQQVTADQLIPFDRSRFFW